MKKYTVKIDLNDGNGFFDVFPTRISPFKKSLEPNEMFRRYKWGDVEFRNLPTKYKIENVKPSPSEALLNAYSIYDKIKEAVSTKEINIQFVYGNTTINGYFGYVDCQYKDDNISKSLTVTPTTIDQYSDFLENYEEQFALIDNEANDKIINGDFNSWIDLIPRYWKQTPLQPIAERKYINNDFVCALYPTDPASEFSQTISVIKDRIIQVDFDWDLLLHTDFSGLNPGYSITEDDLNTIYDDRYVQITLNGTYQLNADGTWGAIGSGIKFADQIVVKKFSEIPSDLFHFILVSDQIPEDGELKINFINTGYDETFIGVWGTYTVKSLLLIDNVSIITTNLVFTDVEIPNSDTNKVDYNYFTINDGTYFYAYPDWDFYGKASDLKEFYFDSVTGAPNESVWNITDHIGLRSVKGGLFLNDIDQKISDASNQEFYKCQLSKVIVYTDRHDQKANNDRIDGRRRQRVYAELTYSRDEKYSINSPTGDGWEILVGKDNEKGEHLWVRKPYNDEDNKTQWSIGAIEIYAPGEYTGEPQKLPTKSAYVRQRIESHRDYTTIDDPENPGSSPEPTRIINYGLLLKDVIKTLFNNVHPSYADKNIYSTFLWNDLENELAVLSEENSGANYISMVNPNPLNNIVCIHTPDFKLYESTDPKDKKFKISFKEFMDDLKILFLKHTYGNLYWFIDENYELHIEHVRYREMKGFSGQVIPENEYYKNYKHETSNMPSRIIIDQVNSGNEDFHKNEILFPKIFTGKRGKEILLESITKYLTTDLQYCIDNPDGLKNGLCLKNFNTDSLGNIKSVYRNCQLSGNSMLNGELALSTLIDLYCREEGTWIIGYVNKEEKRFASTFRTKLADEITVKKVYDENGNIILNGIIDGDYLLTLLGSGMVKEMEHDFDNELTRITMLYVDRPELLADELSENSKVTFDFGGF